MIDLLHELFGAMERDTLAPDEVGAITHLDIRINELQRQIERLRMIIAVLCTTLVQRGVVDRESLLGEIRQALIRLDPLTPPSVMSEPPRPASTPHGGPYRDPAIAATKDPGAEPLRCVRCGRLVPQRQTNLTAEGPICDICWEPRI